ncbi:MAG: pyridoxamine 5'-phosphate oxidase family protein [Actinobacteria bacterium]|nr:pyridoxamine 5'-phosphate oxidase family protein [Actinomycetota bacterium]
MRETRRKDRVIGDQETWDLLRRAKFGVLSTVSAGGKPYGVPLNYCLGGDFIYFHCALEGRKVENLEHEKWVSFCVVGDTEVMPEKFGTKYESAIATGRVEEVFGESKQAALEGLVRKYSADFLDEGLGYIRTLGGKTRVFRIKIQHLSGKARRR